MTKAKEKVVHIGPSSWLISRINHLSDLLANLPDSIPLDPPNSRYQFGLDPEHVSEEGVWFAFNKNLEACFQTHDIRDGGSIQFQERGRHYKDLINMFKDVVRRLETDRERDFLAEVWLERLITAAKLQGAKIPAK